jgi:hypothetical protein
VSVAVAFGLRDNIARAVGEDVAAEPLAQTTALMLGASLVLLANLLPQRSALTRLRTAFVPDDGCDHGHARPVERLEDRRLGERSDDAGRAFSGPWSSRRPSSAAAELVRRRLVVVALLVVAGSTLVGATR